MISNRPFQNVSLPQVKTTGDFSGIDIPYILGDYGASSASVLSKQLHNLYKVPYVRNDNDNLVFLLPNKIADTKIVKEAINAILRGFVEKAKTLSIAKLDSFLKLYLVLPLNLFGALNSIVSVSIFASIKYKIPLKSLEFSLNLFKISI